ncbi:MAG: ABC transporter substrate-binding protein [Chloroflexi bacterium]|nr:ABC transporter substrate-binding protein [Chloroflexota bacterium]
MGLSALSLLTACGQSAPAPAKPGESKPGEAKPAAAPAASKPAENTAAAPTAAPQAAAAKPAATTAVAPSVGTIKAPEANPKRGGVIKIGGFGDPAHFDLDQSPSLVNLWQQSPMYDNLIRFNPNDGGRTIVPDLAEKWEVAPDGSTYTFNLRKGVKFHDGSDFTADDVIATFQRRKAPPEGVVSIRQELFRVIKSIEAPDPFTVKFVMSEPRGYFLEALATGWSVILSKKSLEANKNDLRRVADYPGTGPYKYVEFKPRDKWVFEKNPNYWNKEVPYVDRMERLSIPEGKDRGTAVLSGQIDFADSVSMDTYMEALKRENDVGARLNPVTWANTTTFNTQKAPFNDARVRRAVHLAINRQDLAKVYELSDNINVGTRWVHPSSPLATNRDDNLKLPGYRPEKDADIADAKKLMAAAGLENGVKEPLVLLLRGLTGPGIEVYAPAFQDMLKRNLGLEAVIKPVETSVYWDTVRAGDYHLTWGSPAGAINDPSDYWSQWFKTDGPQNYAKYSNPKFDALLEKIDKELDLEKRKALAHEAEDLLDQECPMFMHGWVNLARIWRKDVKGLNHDIVGSYIVTRYDTVWLDR